MGILTKLKINNQKSKISQDIIKSADTERTNRIPPHQRLTKDFLVLHYNGIPRFNKDRWTFRIWGLVTEERRLSYDEFVSLPKVNVYADIHCVTGWSKIDNLWYGFSSREIKNLVSIRPEAKYVMVYCADNYYTNLSLDDFFEDDVLFALKYNNQNITPEHGYPVRLVVPRLYFWKSAKWVTGLQFLSKDTPGYWESRGYHNHGDPWLEERYA